jgi:hypothetical protein
MRFRIERERRRRGNYSQQSFKDRSDPAIYLPRFDQFEVDRPGLYMCQSGVRDQEASLAVVRRAMGSCLFLVETSTGLLMASLTGRLKTKYATANSKRQRRLQHNHVKVIYPGSVVFITLDGLSLRRCRRRAAIQLLLDSTDLTDYMFWFSRDSERYSTELTWLSKICPWLNDTCSIFDDTSVTETICDRLDSRNRDADHLNRDRDDSLNRDDR